MFQCNLKTWFMFIVLLHNWTIGSSCQKWHKSCNCKVIFSSDYELNNSDVSSTTNEISISSSARFMNTIQVTSPDLTSPTLIAMTSPSQSPWSIKNMAEEEDTVWVQSRPIKCQINSIWSQNTKTTKNHNSEKKRKFEILKTETTNRTCDLL